MMQGGPVQPAPAARQAVSHAAMGALTLQYSAPMPGVGSRYADGLVAHETRLLGLPPLAAALAGGDRPEVGETVFAAVSGSLALAGFADWRVVALLAPLARAALWEERIGKVLAGLSNADLRPFARALGAAGADGPLPGALGVALGAGRDATLRDAMRFAASEGSGDAVAREYARGYEVTRTLALPALVGTFARVEATRPALVGAFLEILAEVPDLDVARRAGLGEAEEVSRTASGVLKAGGVNARRGLQAISNFDGLLRADARLAPTATEALVGAAAFLLALERGARYLNLRVRPASRR